MDISSLQPSGLFSYSTQRSNQTKLIMKYFVAALCFAVFCSIAVSWFVLKVLQLDIATVCLIVINNKCKFCWFQAVTDEQRQIADKVGKDCASENGLTADDVQKIRTSPKTQVSDPKAQVKLLNWSIYFFSCRD